jgi:hypothetical protein
VADLVETLLCFPGRRPVLLLADEVLERDLTGRA